MKYIIGEDIAINDAQTMSQVFFQHEGFEEVLTLPKEGLCLRVEKRADEVVCATLFEDGEVVDASIVEEMAGEKKALPTALAIYNVLSRHTGYRPPWGVLTGIRPAKLATALYSQGLDVDEVVSHLMETYLVREDKARLCAAAAIRQGCLMSTSLEEAVSIYINIPFCPTKCHYCSFAAYPMDKYKNRMEAYMEALVKEAKALAGLCKGMHIENIYIGGGTPTALDDASFERLLSVVADSFDMANVKEYTVEAGRPDTITPTKLELMRKYDVNRISINPQTLKSETLEKIGRKHSVADFFEAYNLALEYGFKNINIDLILGLEGEAVEDVEATFKGIMELNPKSITVHNLSIKRASKIKEELDVFEQTQNETIEEMQAICKKYMDGAGLTPYYLYRQKNSLGNMENVGYARAGFEGRYNVHMMEENRPVYAVGCGAISKLVCLETGKIERIFNFKGLDEYIRDVDKMIERKMERLS